MKLAAGLLLFALTATAHTGEALQPHDLPTAWFFAPSIVVPLILAAWLYWRGGHPRDGITRSEAGFFWLGWTALALALVSPIHAAGEFLFSMHMVQHEIVMNVAAPLLVLGRPLVRFLWALPAGWRKPAAAAGSRFGWMTNATFATVLHAIAIWVWHYPPLFDATLHSEWVHSAQHTSFLVTALLFWWSVFRGGPGPALANLLVTTIHTGALGALLTFSSHTWFPDYASRSVAWGFSPFHDQQLGGLVMWIPGSLSYFAAALYLAARILRPAAYHRIPINNRL